MDHPVVRETVIAAPGAGYVGAWLAGMHVPDAIQVCMLIYAIGLAVRTIYTGACWLKNRIRGTYGL
jgi:hypothetical protein